MELFGHFKYAGRDSATYGLILANVGTSAYKGIAGQVSDIKIFNKRNMRNYFVGYDYSEAPLSLDIEIVTEQERCLTRDEQRDVENWLFYQQGYQKFYITKVDACDDDYTESVDGNVKNLYLNCVLMNPEKIDGFGGVCGYKATLVADSPFALQDAIRKSYAVSGGMVIVNVDSDAHEYIYPRVTLLASGSITLVNQSDSSSRITGFDDLPASSSIIMDSSINYISDPYYEKFSNKNFIRLVPGENRISITGNISSISFEWQNRRYL